MINVKEGMLKAIESYERDIWGNIPKFSKYEVNLYGEVRNKRTLNIIKQKDGDYGYPCQKLMGDDGRWHLVSSHRSVAFAFIPNPKPNEYNQVHHKDEDKLNCYYKNLQWCSNQQNCCFNGLNERRAKEIREKCGKKVYCYDENGELVHKIDSLELASKKLNVDRKSIKQAINFNEANNHFIRLCRGYFVFSTPQNKQYILSRITSRNDKINNKRQRKRKLFQYDLKRNLIKSYNSISEAAKENGFSRSGITQCCLKIKEKYNSFIWSYEEL